MKFRPYTRFSPQYDGFYLKLANQVFEELNDPKRYFRTALKRKQLVELSVTSPEWLAEVADCPEALRADIRRLFQRIAGEFVYEGNEGEYYQFRHFYTKRLFRVPQQSVELKGVLPGELVFTTIVNWRGDWWVTGTLAGFGDSKEAARKSPPNMEPGTISYYAYETSQQQSLREMASDMEQAHLEFFGERLVFFKNNRDLQAALQKQTEYYNQTKSKDQKKRETSGRPIFDAQSDFDLSDMDLGKGFAIFFEPGEGLSISASIPIVAQRLAQRNISADHAAELYFYLFNECSPAVVRYLLEKYSM